MKVELSKSFPLPGPAEVAWAFLQDVEAAAGCMPGAAITERVAEGRFRGTMTVKIGPATMSFRGDVEVSDVDPSAMSLRLLGKGTDSTGTSGASMDLKARIEPAAEGLSTLVGVSEVSMSGKAAAFGGRMMSSVADHVMRQFAANFSAQVAALSAQRVAGAKPAAAAADDVTSSTGAGNPDTGGTVTKGPPSVPHVANELNGVTLAWAVFKDWLRSLFRRKPA